MKFIIISITLLFAATACAEDCQSEGRNSEAVSLGYLGFMEQAKKNALPLVEQPPIILWWVGNGGGDYDYDSEKNFGIYFGFAELSKREKYKDAGKLLTEKKADSYVMAWVDEEVKGSKRVTINVSVAMRAWSAAYNSLVTLGPTPSVNRVLKCSENLLN